MYYFFLVLIIIAAVLLILIVLVQNSKGGGLASGFSSANQYGGVVQTNKFLETATWTLAISLVVLSLLASMTVPREAENANKSIIQEKVNSASDYSNVPVLPQNTTTFEEGENSADETE